ncbi:unnamed protein product [Rotaria sp. Silwood1]|nr:unnamed protein product [Rotaria sp. Silwood1]
MPDKSTSKIEMINECRLCYEIKDFEQNYSVDEAISWYTRDSFLFRTLNKALRTENIDIVFKFRFFFLTDLLNQLKFLHNEFMELLDDMVLTVFSWRMYNYVALLFAGQGDSRPLRESVLFQIKIYTQDNLKPFANIKEKSFMKDEDEILFSLGTIFRIESVESLDQYVWLVNLILSGDEDQQLQNLRKYFQDNLDQTSSINDLGDFLYKIGDYNRAQNYYRILLNKYPSDHRDLVMIYCNMGVLQHCQNNYREASNYFTTAFLLLANSLPFKNDHDHIDFATLNYNLACSIAKFQGYRVALSIFKRALDRLNKYVRTNHPSLINMYNGYALANADNGLFGMAIFYHTVALTIAETMTPINQLDLANTYYSMGLTYKLKKDYSQALDSFQKSVHIRRLCLPENHPDLADVCHNIAHIYNYQGHYELTLQTYEKVLEIYLKSHLINYCCLTMVHIDIGNVHRNNGNYDIAMNKYKQALEIIENNPTEYCNNLAQVYMNIGLLYECQHSHSEALAYLEKAASAVKKLWAKDQLDLAIIYNHMGLIHCKNQNHQVAIENLKKCLDIRLNFLYSTHSDIIATYNDIDQVNELKQTLTDLKETTEVKERKDEPNDSFLPSPTSNKLKVVLQQNICAANDTFDNIHEHSDSDNEVLDLRITKTLKN